MVLDRLTVTVLDSKSGTVKSVAVGPGDDLYPFCPYCIAVDSSYNNIYVANAGSDTVSVIDGNSDTVKKTILVQDEPTFILVASESIYVANSRSNTVSVIDRNSDTVKKTITVGMYPTFILMDDITGGKVYVASDSSVSVINPGTDTLNNTIFYPLTNEIQSYPHGPMAMYMNYTGVQRELMVIPGMNSGFSPAYSITVKNSAVKQIPFTLANNKTLSYGYLDAGIAPGAATSLPTMVSEYIPTMLPNFVSKQYVLNRYNATVSMFGIPEHGHRYTETTIHKHIKVGQRPDPIAINYKTQILYIGYPRSDTVSVINGFTDRVAVGVIFNVNPSDSGIIKCNNTIYPSNTYIYVDSGTNCTAQRSNGTDFEFNTWTESQLTNLNSSTPLEQSSEHPPETIAVDRYGIFTANFKPPQHLTTDQLVSILAVAIAAAVAVNGVILLIPGWRRARNQRIHLEECIKMIDNDVGKSHKDAIEDKIIGYYVKGKLSEDHRQLLKDKISEYYGSVKDSESGA